MVAARSLTLGLAIVAALGAWLWTTVPKAPSTTLVGTSPDAQAEDHAHSLQLAFLAKLKAAAGANARECGVFALSDDPKNGISCGAEALSRHAPFWLAVELGGTDTTTWVGLAQDTNGGVFQLNWLKDPWFGGRIMPAERCTSLSFNSSAAYRQDLFSCPSAVVP